MSGSPAAKRRRKPSADPANAPGDYGIWASAQTRPREISLKRPSSISMTTITRTLPSLASLDYIFLSPAYFSRLFKEKSERILKIIWCGSNWSTPPASLQSGHYKIFEISQIVGYKSTKYFYRLFKSYYGCTPNEFRQNWQMKGETDDDGRK